MTHTGTVPLETWRLILRRFEISDAEAIYRNWASDNAVTKYLRWKPHSSTDETRRVLSELWLPHYDKPDFYQWAIEIKNSNELIGSISVVKQDNTTKMVHIGYCIGQKWWGKGYTSEALTRLVRFFFEDVRVNRIESLHDPRNPNSGKVMLKSGLRYEGTSLQSDWNNQGICDAVNYAILAKEYFRKPEQGKSVNPTYRKADVSDINCVTNLLCKLYKTEPSELLAENKSHFADSRQCFFLAFDSEEPAGAAHVSLRSDYVNGTASSGICGYLEGIYVEPQYRNRGIAAALVRMCETWSKEQGSREFASDCLIHNTDSYLFHLRLGFTETERCIFFRKEYAASAESMDGKLENVTVMLIKTDKKRFLDLLLLADESETMVDKYLERGELFALYDGDLKSVCVVTRENNDTCELKNIATYEKYHGLGYGSRLIKYITALYKDRYKTMFVGTGDVPKSLRFYRKNGFEISHRVKNFFIDNYSRPIYEDGIQLADMVYLKREL